MARGAEGKLRRRNEKKKAREEASSNDPFMAPVEEDDSDVDEQAAGANVPPPKKKQSKAAAAPVPQTKKQGIKTLPLILLLLLTGTAVLPALIYASDFLGAYFQKHHVFGAIGYKLGFGPSPKKRVLSFYEKHDPSKIDDVDTILAKYYGDYPKLLKKLERKYGDYGYFLEWEQDEAPMTVALEHVANTRDYIGEQFNLHAPQVVKTAARNVRYNLTFLYKRGRKAWKKHVWPLLEPIFGVPKGTAAQKRKDAQEARERKKQGQSGRTRRKNTDFRDDVEDEV
jgi:hypothetical protein